MRFFVRQKPTNDRVHALIDELPERVMAIIEHFPDVVAEMALEDLVSRAPKDIPRYPKMLQLRRLELPGIDSVSGIVVPGYEHSQRLKMSNAADTVLYIRAKGARGSGPDPGAAILEKYSPWTMVELPFEPHRTQGAITSRRVTEREVRRVAEQNKKDRPTVDQALKDLGLTPGRPHATLVKRRVSRDIAFEVLRREFGITAKHKAHWRPVVLEARTKYPDRIFKKLVRWLAVPSERRWKRNLTTKPERASTAKRIKRFQDHIA